MRPISLAELEAPLQARLVGADLEFLGVSTDSRQLARGDLFVALRGEHFDGHDYLDLLGDYSSGLLGHDPGPVRAAVGASLDRGWSYGGVHTDEIAQLFSQSLPILVVDGLQDFTGLFQIIESKK